MASLDRKLQFFGWVYLLCAVSMTGNHIRCAVKNCEPWSGEIWTLRVAVVCYALFIATCCLTASIRAKIIVAFEKKSTSANALEQPLVASAVLHYGEPSAPPPSPETSDV
jgi:hypothetical protein